MLDLWIEPEDNNGENKLREIKNKLSSTKIIDVFSICGCRHEAVIPIDTEYTELSKDPLCTAKKYNFELDIFQKLAISAIEREETVMVNAHTSSGKTVVAEYAIADSFLKNQKVIYTSPLKALSNQKFRELRDEFKDVGLITGDITINPNASCLVMTTEILRNMLYKETEMIKDVRWIIFDEIHYMANRQRGLVWEESIILLPNTTKMIFLSATFPNALEFAEWIAQIKEQAIHVIYTEIRPVPLVYYLYTNKPLLIKDKVIYLNEYIEHMKSLPKDWIPENQVEEALKFVRLPVIVFSFVRRECEKYAMNLSEDFLTIEEKRQVQTIFENTIKSIQKDDLPAPILEKYLPLFLKGIGIHHSGLLPVIREIVEILFQKSLIKVLFATETFSIGLNMPAKSVILSSISKFNGITNDFISANEIVQMGGRAGRRGIDKVGEVVIILDEIVTENCINTSFKYPEGDLISAFRLTYNTVLHLIKNNKFNPLYFLSRTFYHYKNYKETVNEIKNLPKLSAVPATVLSDLLLRRMKLYISRNRKLSKTFQKRIKDLDRIVSLLIPKDGYILFIRNAIVDSFNESQITVNVIIDESVFLLEYPIEYVCTVYDMIYTQGMKPFYKKYKPIFYGSYINKQIKEVEEQIYKIVPEINFDCCIYCKQESNICLRNCEYASSNNVDFDNGVEHLRFLYESECMAEKIDLFEKKKKVHHVAEGAKMIKVMRNLNYIDETSILLKGELASMITTANELVLTEILFNSEFNSLELMEMLAILSCFVCDEKSNYVSLNEENTRLFGILFDCINKICETMQNFGIEINKYEYKSNFSGIMMNIVRMWASGKSFKEICKNTYIFEGNIIRWLKRLDELLKELIEATKKVNNSKLHDLFTRGELLIRRSILSTNTLKVEPTDD